MRIGIAQINTTVGDLGGNSSRILNAYKQLVDEGADIVVYPELVVCGYPPRDLLFKSRFVNDVEKTLLTIAEQIGSVPAVIGYVSKRSERVGRPFYNSVAWCANGCISTIGHKSLLPTYDVFDEERYFEPANEPAVVDWNGKIIGLTICEDIWIHPDIKTSRTYCADPVKNLIERKIDMLLNLSASPWYEDKTFTRMELIRDVASRCGCPVVYCNAIGGNDELIFDGSSIVADPHKGIIAGFESFREDIRVINLKDNEHKIAHSFNLNGMAAVHEALVLGLKDYAQKCGFKRALIGLSGGIDSAVVAALAVEALGSENIIGVALPSSISSQHSVDDAAELAKNLKIEFHEIAISEMVKSTESTLAPLFKDMKRDVTEENIQARSRGVILMAVSNKLNALLLTTGNKSEISVGYCTLYGDMAGGLAVISDLPKMKVYALANFINRNCEIIPDNTISKAPSAELSPGQKDEDSLPPYPVLDKILRLYVEKGHSTAEIVECGYDVSIVKDVIRKVDLNEYKRKQAAPGLKITSLAFGVGRRIPIVQKYVS